MNILFPTWKNFGVEDIKKTFEELGHKVSLYEREPKNYRIDPRYKSEIKKYIKENDIVLLFTGWDNFYGKEEYYTEHPVVSRELAELLIKKKIKMLGMDMPSPDRDNYEIHNVLFENDIFLLENLTNLNKLLYNEEIQLFAQPLKVQSEASLVRAVAIYQGY